MSISSSQTHHQLFRCLLSWNTAETGHRLKNTVSLSHSVFNNVIADGLCLQEAETVLCVFRSGNWIQGLSLVFCIHLKQRNKSHKGCLKHHNFRWHLSSSTHNHSPHTHGCWKREVIWQHVPCYNVSDECVNMKMIWEVKVINDVNMWERHCTDMITLHRINDWTMISAGIIKLNHCLYDCVFFYLFKSKVMFTGGTNTKHIPVYSLFLLWV